MKTYGWEAVLKPLINELKILETRGINLTIDGIETNFKVILSFVTGDNLFLNSILGFVESFSAHHPCRQCLVSKDKFDERFDEDANLVRTRLSYDEAVASPNVQQTGIKSNCPFNALTMFHASSNFVQDIMHDILEGVCKYNIVILCKHLINNNFFSLEVLNSRLQSINYGIHEVKNRPPFIITFDNETLPFQASEMWSLVLHLPIAVGEFLPDDDVFWKWFLCLRKIMDIIFAPTIVRQEILLLRVLISEYLKQRKRLYPDSPLKNKHHHLVHYPRVIEQLGPMIRMWCMRFESKHQRYKRLMHISCNFKNVPYSIANRHQFDVAYNLMTSRSSEIVCGLGSVLSMSQLASLDDNLVSELGSNADEKWYHCNTVVVKGTKYKVGCYLLTMPEHDDELPQCFLVNGIYIQTETEAIKFYCEKLLVLGFEDHFHGYAVDFVAPKIYTFINLSSLLYYLPLALHAVTHNAISMHIVVPRFRL